MKRKPKPSTVGTTLTRLQARLELISATPALDAQLLLGHLLERSRTWLLAHPDELISSGISEKLEALVSRLEGGQPLPYLLGHWEFFGLDLEVTPDVLIPRPETELLVENALAWLRDKPNARRFVDVGCGSGCIGIALVVNIPDLTGVCLDISPAALEVARRNAARHGVDARLEFLCTDLLSAPGHFNLIVANLPYIATSTMVRLPIYGHEPTLALDGGPDGMVVIRRLLDQVPGRLLPGGLLLMETEASAGKATLTLAQEKFPNARFCLLPDLAGHDRLLEVQL